MLLRSASSRKYDPSGRFLPPEAQELAWVVGWLSFAANEIQNGAQLARMHVLLGLPIALEQTQATTRESLALLDVANYRFTSAWRGSRRALIEQHRSAWTHELDLQPWTERF